MIVGVSHIARTEGDIPDGWEFCEELPNHPAKFPFLSEPHATHTIAFYPGKPALEVVRYPKMGSSGFLDSDGAQCIALLSSRIEKDAEAFSDCFTTGSFPMKVNGRYLLIQLFRTRGGEFIELVQPCA